MNRAAILKTLLILVLFASISCDKDEQLEGSLSGEWSEVEPVRDRTTLIFTSGNRLTRIDGEGNEEYLKYEIKDDSILLSLASGQEGTSELFFQKPEQGRLRIGNLYPSIPENQEVILVFERVK
ncbi:hypothetical protein [Salinimicrobium terrae]|uniref:hypothetical protein n=1 Tax=Salinimicrobium terrae TaxID=470866 RepID=UPI0004114F71|nr:hypothetical protein [Salinimicrobium terrae]